MTTKKLENFKVIEYHTPIAHDVIISRIRTGTPTWRLFCPPNGGFRIVYGNATDNVTSVQQVATDALAQKVWMRVPTLILLLFGSELQPEKENIMKPLHLCEAVFNQISVTWPGKLQDPSAARLIFGVVAAQGTKGCWENHG